MHDSSPEDPDHMEERLAWGTGVNVYVGSGCNGS